jgi:hypothetical protein
MRENVLDWAKKLTKKYGDTDFLVSDDEEGPSPDAVLSSLVAISFFLPTFDIGPSNFTSGHYNHFPWYNDLNCDF